MLNLNHSLWLLNMYYHLIIRHIDLFPTIEQGLKQLSGSARVFEYSVFGGVLNRVYGIL